MSPAVKYTLGRLGLFAVCFTALLPVPLNLFVKMMVAFVLSAGLSLVFLRRQRDETSEQISDMLERRSAEKERLRSALAGDETAATAGDRVATAEPAATEPVAEPVKKAGKRA